jgi:PHD/YefM family antitoxin component YafN of YafNO toxin-antitoxin module
MDVQMTARPYESPGEDLYDPAMAKVESMSVEEARKVLGQRVDKARDEEVHTALTKHGRLSGVLVPPDWYRRMREMDGDPTDL